MVQEPSYTIGKLAKKAETTPRTIRYYQEQGLLPAPTMQGKYSHYSETHLLRLLLIQKLKNAFLPLASIREQMEGLTDEEVRAILAHCSPSGKTAATSSEISVGVPDPVPLGKRAAYLTQVLEVSGQTASAGEKAQRAKVALLVSPNLKPAEVLPQQEMDSAPACAQKLSERETWERVPLASGVELHVRIPATSAERQILEQRIAAAEALFTTDI